MLTEVNEGREFNEKNKNWLLTIGSVIPAIALVITTFNVNTTCTWIVHQDKLPKNAKKLRKF